MDYRKASVYWTDKEASSEKLECDVLATEVEKFILSHNTCALATADLDGFVRNTPIEYNYKDGCFWMFSEGGLKFKALEANKNVCLAIYDSYEGFGKLSGMQVSGVAEMIEPWSDEYLELLKHKGISVENLKKMSVVMNLIKVKPVAIDFLNSEFKARGVDSRQHLDF